MDMSSRHGCLVSHLASPVSHHGFIALRRLLNIPFIIPVGSIVSVMSLNVFQC